MTALANDVAFDVVFARQLAALARAGDVAVGLSTSGNSANLIRAFDVAARQGLLTVGFAGYEGGQMAEMDVLDYLFVVPSASVHRIQEAQTTLYQALWELTINAVERRPSTVVAGPRGSPVAGRQPRHGVAGLNQEVFDDHLSEMIVTEGPAR